VRILALETSGRFGSIALLDNMTVVLDSSLDPPFRTAQSLAPGIRQCLREAGWEGLSIDAVAVTQGPGSFTGLRLGVTTAKTLAYVWESRLIGINTLATIAAQSPANIPLVAPAIDAFRQQTFTAAYCRDEQGQWQEKIATCVVDDAEWFDWLPSGAAVTGAGLHKFPAGAMRDVAIINSECWQPRAATVGQLAANKLRAGHSDDLWNFVPNYFRQSAAEEKQSQAGKP